LVAARGCCTRAIEFDEANLVTMVGGQHVETKHQPVGSVFYGLWETGFTPRIPEQRAWPVIDMDGDRQGGLGVDTDQADDRAEIGDAVDAYA
jgi:hypothetical protein